MLGYMGTRGLGKDTGQSFQTVQIDQPRQSWSGRASKADPWGPFLRFNSRLSLWGEIHCCPLSPPSVGHMCPWWATLITSGIISKLLEGHCVAVKPGAS